jgi:two-component sensor histidine kinase
MAWQEAAYTFLVSGTFGAVILLLRSQASKADLASELSAKASGDQARVDAIERERYRIDSLMHDKVFTTLILASQAKSVEDENIVTGLAQEAIQAINRAGNDSSTEHDSLSVSSYFLSLEESISQAFSSVKVVLASGSDFGVPADVASAIAEATLQAVQNSVQHAGPASLERSVRLKAHHDGFKIVIVDNGKGFRVSRVAKDRLGVRLSIISKVEQVGGRVFIDSRIGEGTNVIIDWHQDA